MTANSTDFKHIEPAKKPYVAPRLEVYGDIREVTASVGMMTNADGAAHGMTKTS
jgi:hypothetical protein